VNINSAAQQATDHDQEAQDGIKAADTHDQEAQDGIKAADTHDQEAQDGIKTADTHDQEAQDGIKAGDTHDQEAQDEIMAADAYSGVDEEEGATTEDSKTDEDDDVAKKEKENMPCHKKVWIWWCHVYAKNSFLILVVLAVLLALAYPPLGAVYLAPEITATWIAVIFIFGTFNWDNSRWCIPPGRNT
jgi:hypothetical protein